jgi:hypothetical protein
LTLSADDKLPDMKAYQLNIYPQFACGEKGNPFSVKLAKMFLLIRLDREKQANFYAMLSFRSASNG